MRYLDIKDFDINNGDGIRVSLWVSGCSFKCKGCHNEISWDKNKGRIFDEESKKYLFSLMNDDIEKDLSILGGEPLAPYNRDEVLKLCKEFKEVFPNKSIWLWSGYSKKQIERFMPDLFNYIDVLVDGIYIDELKNEELMWRGSINQKIYHFNQ